MTHEESDVNVRGILIFVAGLFVLMGVTLLLMYYMLNFFEAQERRREPQPGPMAFTEKERIPPEPRLQSAPGFQAEGQNLELREPQAEIKVIRKRWDEVLQNGSTDEQTGTRTAIPIKDAMKQVIEQNALKSRPAEGNQQQQATDQLGEMPSDSSSGRMMEKRDQ